jgi:tagatose 1,6-diphosphate aldolase GatY/KbaY
MRAHLDRLARSAVERGRAVGAFTCYDFATAYGVVAAATQLDEGVALLISPSTAATAYGQDLVRGLRSMADHAPVPVSIQLDHASDLELIRRTVESGADAVLVDGSRNGYAGNVELVRQAADVLRDLDCALEAELGRIAGDEDVAALIASGSMALTDPDQAAEFVRETGVGLLAVSVGNVHGSYLGQPVIDHDRLDALAASVDVPLVLHGASGLPPATLRRCVASGVGKVNVNTELRTALLTHLAESTPAVLTNGANLERLMNEWTQVASAQVTKVLATLTAG